MPYGKRVSAMQMLALAETRLALGYAEIRQGNGEWAPSAGFRRLIGIADGQDNPVNAIAAAFHPDDRPAFLEAILLVRGGYVPTAGTYRTHGSQAAASHVSLQFVSVDDAAGTSQILICLAQDVSARAALRQSMSDAEARMDRLMELMEIDCFWRSDRVGNLFDYRMRGVLRRDGPILGMGWLDIIPEADREEVAGKVLAAKAVDAPYRLTLPIIGNDGVPRDYVSSGFPVRDASDRVTEWSGVAKRADNRDHVSEAGGDASVAEAAALVTGAAVKGLCALFGWTYEDVSRLSGLSLTTINRFAGNPGPLTGRFRRKSVESCLQTFADAGAIFLIRNESDLFFCRTTSVRAGARRNN